MDFDDQPQALTRDRLDGMDAEEDGPCGDGMDVYWSSFLASLNQG